MNIETDPILSLENLQEEIRYQWTRLRNGEISAQGSDDKKHGKLAEIALSIILNFVDENGEVYEQQGDSCDTPKHIVEKSRLPKELHHDVEVKFYNKRCQPTETRKGNLMLGDLVRKCNLIQKTLVVIAVYYDETPMNLHGIDFIKLEPTPQEIDYFKKAEEIYRQVKDKSIPVLETRSIVREFNARNRGLRFYLNNNSNSKTDGRQMQICYAKKKA
jgi:hypothetical protein